MVSGSHVNCLQSAINGNRSNKTNHNSNFTNLVVLQLQLVAISRWWIASDLISQPHVQTMHRVSAGDHCTMQEPCTSSTSVWYVNQCHTAVLIMCCIEKKAYATSHVQLCWCGLCTILLLISYLPNISPIAYQASRQPLVYL